MIAHVDAASVTTALALTVVAATIGALVAVAVIFVVDYDRRRARIQARRLEQRIAKARRLLRP